MKLDTSTDFSDFPSIGLTLSVCEQRYFPVHPFQLECLTLRK